MLTSGVYEKVAEILHNRAKRVPPDLVADFADWFESDNPGFDRWKCINACLLGKEKSKPS